MTLRECLELVFEGNDPERHIQALFVACSWLRGFNPTDMRRELWMKDAVAWIDRHGQPTRENLMAWADGLGVESAIPAAAANRNLDLLACLPPGRLLCDDVSRPGPKRGT